MALLAEDKFEESAVAEVMRFIDEGYGNGDGVITEEEWIAAMLDTHRKTTDEAFFRECEGYLDLLLKNQREFWRMRYRARDAANLVSALRAAGLTHAVFIHHANAVPPPKGSQTPVWSLDDQSRSLSNRGQAQCIASRSSWFAACPLRRTMVCRFKLPSEFTPPPY